jgi:hypothetical protein
VSVEIKARDLRATDVLTFDAIVVRGRDGESVHGVPIDHLRVLRDGSVVVDVRFVDGTNRRKVFRSDESVYINSRGEDA